MSSNNATYSLAGAWACGYACVGVSPLQPVWLEGWYTHTRILLPPWGGRNSISIPAASYSPTRSLVQYHQRWKA